MEEAALADRVIVMDSGKIVLDGKPKEIFKEVETLKGIGLDVPQVTYLSYLLKGTKLELPADVLTAEECADALLKRLEAIK
jgi:energy-coupling factor transport system ATP-binding protein